MNPKVSILIPVYNVSAYIQKCAYSLFEQTFRDEVEYVFVNDATPDNSMEKLLEVIEKYPFLQGKIRIIQHEQNKGLASARKTALSHATGNYVLVVDSDDYIDSDMVEVLYHEAIVHKADIVVSDIIMEYGDRTVYRTDYLSDDPAEHFRDIVLDEASHSYLCNKLIRRTLYNRNECQPPDGLNYLEDRHAMIRLFYFAEKIIKVNRGFYHYVHYNVNAITKTKGEMHFENVLLFWKLLDEFLIQQNCFPNEPHITELAKVRCKVILMFDTNSVALRKKYADIFLAEEMRNLKFLTSGERCMLFFIRHKLFIATKVFREILLVKQKLLHIIER